jgi:hypothetical protein
MSEDFRQYADLEIPVGTVDAGELAYASGMVDDIAHIRLSRVRAGGGCAQIGIQHAALSCSLASLPH